MKGKRARERSLSRSYTRSKGGECRAHDSRHGEPMIQDMMNNLALFEANCARDEKKKKMAEIPKKRPKEFEPYSFVPPPLYPQPPPYVTSNMALPSLQGSGIMFYHMMVMLPMEYASHSYGSGLHGLIYGGHMGATRGLVSRLALAVAQGMGSVGQAYTPSSVYHKSNLFGWLKT